MNRVDVGELLSELEDLAGKASFIVPLSLGNVLSAYKPHEKAAVDALLSVIVDRCLQIAPELKRRLS